MINKWAPKSTHFSYKGMVARCKLAAIDFNKGETLEQAKTKSGDYCYVCFSKITKTWSARPVKDTKSVDVFSNLVDLTEESVTEKKKLTEIELPHIPRNIASVENPDKKDIAKNQKSRFAI